QETPSPFTPLGAKGLGEANNMSTPPCIANAIADALGIETITLPVTPSRVMELVGIEAPPSSRASARDVGPSPSTKTGKALTATGEVQLPAEPAAVFAVLLDPNALAKVIPGCHGLQGTGENQYKADVTVGIGMIKARYAAEVTLSEL